MKNLLIIIPAFNEEKNIGRVLSELTKIPTVKNRGDILVIDDASLDDTANIARSLGATVVSQVYNMGYGSCLQTGYKYAYRKGYEYVIQMDADGQHNAEDVEKIYEVLKGSDDGAADGSDTVLGNTEKGCSDRPVDIVIGSRFLNGDYSSVSFLKRAAGKLFGFIIKAATGVRVTDPTSGFQGLNRRTFTYYAGYTNFDDKYPDANVLMNMLMHGYGIVEIPVVMFERREGKSMHSGIKPMGYMFRMVLSLVAVWIENLRGVT